MIDGLKPYPKMKDSGVPWLGDVPEHWKLAPNHTLMRRRKVLVGSRHSQYRLLSLTKQGVILRDIESGRGKFSADMGTSQEVRAGDLIFCLFDVPETPRTVGLSRHDGMITSAYTVFECSDPNMAAYLDLYYRAMDDRKLLAPLYSGLRNTIPPTRFLGIKSPVPPSAEQADIVRFLGQVDRLVRSYISAKQRFLKLLEEQKQLTIRRGVTRGLDPNVRLKPLGSSPHVEVNVNWRIARLWGTSCVRLEKNRTDLELLSVFFGRGVIPYGEGGGQVHKPSLDLADYQVVHRGDLVLNNQQAWRGSVGVSRHRGIVSPAYLVLQLTGLLDPRYADYLFQSRVMVDQFVTSSKGVGDIQRDIHIPWLKNARIPIPPIDEQQAVAVALDAELADIARQVSLLERGIALSREYSAGLNADVVTGKLDVREAAARLPDVSAELDVAPMEVEMEPDEDLADETAWVDR